MEGSGEKSGSGMSLNLATILALLAVAGSVLLVSHKLSSDRPRSPAGASRQPVGDQSVEARLWEDPFVAWDKRAEEQSALQPTTIAELQKRLDSPGGTNPAPLLLAVMLSGGPYGEDREARIRSRFAIVCALGQSGYAPEDEDHIGASQLPWPATAQFETNDSPPSSLEQLAANGARNLTFSYEWYRLRAFSPRTEAAFVPPTVLVLWLDEDQFGDYPLARVALLFQPLLERTADGPSNNVPDVALLGPIRSSTLRAMLPAGAPDASSFGAVQTSLWPDITKVLQHVRLFTANASAMDEVLVGGTNYPAPRVAVLQHLTNGLFKAAASFCATDRQLAAEALSELSLRGINLAAPQNHLVLISEWDTFYGRMLSLTYAAQVAALQPGVRSPAQFVEDYRANKPVWPTNLHSFVYLRGLDGQTTAKDSESSPAHDTSDEASKASPASLEELKSWNPAANKPEGRAQLDYLSRLGDRIVCLDDELRQNHRGSVGAIGIVGSDVYDTLLILQALRPRFPGAVFFTTGLDARLWDPGEWEWARNLVVVSGHGLQLHADLQRQIPPFRDSSETALFAAALAALGDPRTQTLTEVPPRRWEIGRFGPVDLSVTKTDGLHPVPPGLRGALPGRVRTVILSLVAALFLAGLATLIFRPWIHLTRECRQYQAESLWLREEDIGGVEGSRLIHKHLLDGTDMLTKWLKQELDNWPVQQGSTELWTTRPEKTSETNARDAVTALLKDEDQRQRFLDFLNACLQRNKWVPAHILDATQLLSPESKKRYRDWETDAADTVPFLGGNTLIALQHNRELADEILDRLLHAEPFLGEATAAKRIASRAEAAESARRAGWQKFRLRRSRWRGFWLSVALVGPAAFALGFSAWRDTYGTPFGEPFSLTAGISAWPTECLRFVALALTLGFVAESYAKLRSMALDITRKYRLTLAHTPATLACCLPTMPVPESVVQADHVWERYQQMGFWRNRACRILLPLAAYIGFAFCVTMMGAPLHRPLRGPIIFAWDRWLVWASVIAFLFLTFWTMDSARLCRWFIEHLSEAPSRYPKATREYFSALRGGTPGHLLDEWIDLRLIAEVTERVGVLIYFPFIVFFILLLSRNQWWDLWPWSPSLITIFALNLVLAVAGVVILQRSARRARTLALASLQTKLDQLRGAAAITETQKAQNSLGQAEKLLEEIQGLDTGAFAGFWQNPLVGALLVPSGGTAVIELVQYLFGH
jgi:hypothetical protein